MSNTLADNNNQAIGVSSQAELVSPFRATIPWRLIKRYELAIGRYGFIGFGSKHDVRVIDEGPVVAFVRIDGSNFYIPIKLIGIPNNQERLNYDTSFR